MRSGTRFRYGQKKNLQYIIQQVINNKRETSFLQFLLSLFSLSLPSLPVCLSSLHQRNTLLYLHPNDPSSGPRGWALCTTMRSIRARAWCLLCPIINPYQLSFLLSLPFLSHVCFNCSTFLHVDRSLNRHTQAQTHMYCNTTKLQSHTVNTHILLAIHTIYL